MPGRLPSIFRALTRRRQFEDGLAEELQHHLDQHTRDLIRSGVPEQEAVRRARLELGSLDALKDDCRQARGLRPFDELAHDVRYALRVMRRTPAFTTAALVTLAICLGANLAIFAVVDAVLLRPLPFPHPDRLVSVFNTYPRAGVPDDGSSVTNYYERRDHIPAFERLSLYRDDAVIIGETGRTERAFVTRVTPEFFRTLGVSLARGREFTDEETRYGADRVAIVTDGYWHSRLNADRDVVGRTLRVNGEAYTIVGVLPASFEFLASRPFFLPLASPPDERGPDRRHSGSSSHMIARLRPGATLAGAQSQVDAHNAAMEATDPQAQFIADAGFRSLVVPLRASYVAGVRPMLLSLEAGGICLLLLGAVNVASLLLVRAAGRIRELAVRQAIGAGRRRVVGEVLVETLVLTLIGGAFGLLVGDGSIHLLRLLGTDRLPLGTRLAFDWRAATVALLAAAATGIVLALPIAWYHLKWHVSAALGSDRSLTAGLGAQRLRHGFLVAQMAVALVLVSAAGLLLVSLERLSAVPPGFRATEVLSAQVSLPYGAYPSGTARLAFIDRLTTTLAARPGVAASGISTNVPFSGNANKSAATIEGHAPHPGEPPHGIYSYGVAGNYFQAMGLSLVAGRFLTPADAQAGARVCVIDEDLARRYWPGGGAVGHRLFPGPDEGPESDAFTIVGVVGPVKQAGLESAVAQGAVYYPYADRFDSALYVVIRSSLDEAELATALRDTVRGIDPELPVNNVRPMGRRITDSLIPQRSPAVLAAVFAAIALLLTAIGTYGVVSYSVALRRREIGLRVALGAQPATVGRQFVLLAVRLLLAGLAVGVPIAAVAGLAMRGVLYETPAFDPIITGIAVAVLATACLAAAVIPSVRAARVAPAEALADL